MNYIIVGKLVLDILEQLQQQILTQSMFISLYFICDKRVDFEIN